MQPQDNSLLRRRWLHAVLSTGLLVLSVLLLGTAYPERLFLGHNDFLQLYSGSVLIRTADLYSFSANKELQLHSTGVYLEGVYYSRLPFYALLLSPLGKLPYAQAYWIFQAVSILSYGLFVLLFSSEHPRYAIWAPLFLPLVLNYLAGQDVALVLFFAALFIKFAVGRRDVLAGVFLSLCLIKFHLFLFVPLVLLAHGRRRLFYSAAVSVTMWMMVSFASAGLSWPIRYLAALSSPEIHPGTEHMPTVLGLLGSMGVGRAGAVLAFIGGSVLFWQAIRRSSDLLASLGLALLTGLVLTPHAYVQDCALLLLILPLVSHRCTSLYGRIITVLLMTPIPYLLLLRGVPTNAGVPALLILLAVVAFRQGIVHERGLRHRMQASSGFS